MCAAAPIHTMLLLRERIGDGAGLSCSGDVREIGRRQPASPAHQMASAALTFAPEDLFAVCDVAGKRIVDRGTAQRVDIRDYLPDVRLRQLLWRHRSAGDPVLDDVERLRVRYADVEAIAGYDRRSDFSAAKTVALRAVLVVQSLAFGHSLGPGKKRI